MGHMLEELNIAVLAWRGEGNSPETDWRETECDPTAVTAAG